MFAHAGKAYLQLTSESLIIKAELRRYWVKLQVCQTLKYGLVLIIGELFSEKSMAIAVYLWYSVFVLISTRLFWKLIL